MGELLKIKHTLLPGQRERFGTLLGVGVMEPFLPRKMTSPFRSRFDAVGCSAG